MSTTTEVPKERSISELLELDTYAEMTDSEIDKLLDYKAALMSMEAETTARINARNALINLTIEENRALNDEMREILNKVLNAAPVMRTIESEV